MEQSALAVWYYKSDTRRQAPFVTVREPAAVKAWQHHSCRAEGGASAGERLRIKKECMAQRVDTQNGQQKEIYKMTQQGRAAARKECSGRSPP